jgi:hypothetical protein
MDQISVCFPPGTMKFLRETAEREFRSIGAQVRYYVEDAARRSGAPVAAREPWPPPLEPVTASNLSDVKAKLQTMQVERDKLIAAESKSRTGLMPHDQDRLQFLRGQIEALVPHVQAIERMMA